MPGSRPGTRCLGIEHLAAVLPNEAAWGVGDHRFRLFRSRPSLWHSVCSIECAATLRETRMRMNERSSMPTDLMRLRRIGGSVRELHVRELH
jgi:hypothetical protein